MTMKLTVPAWMEPLRQHFYDTGGNTVERLINDDTSMQVNAPLAMIAHGAWAQYQLLHTLQRHGLLRLPEPERVAADGTVRKRHYGDGVQPWDHMVAEGWAPEFAASCALKYVHRAAAKNGEDDLKKGRWYYARLVEMAKGAGSLAQGAVGTASQLRAVGILKRLQKMLTEAQRDQLRKQGDST